MIRLFFLTFFVIALYLGFSVVNEYDTNIHIELLSYSIDISSFFLLAGAIVAYIIISLLVKILSLILGAPKLIATRIKTAQQKHNINLLLQAYSLALSDNKESAKKITSRIKNELPAEFAMHSHIIFSTTETEPEQQAYHLKHLLDFNEYKVFAAKTLAQYFFKYQYYQQALEYLKQIPNLKSDIDAQITLIEVYSKLQNWEECENSINNLQSLNAGSLKQISPEKIANVYFMAAKDVLESGNDNKAIHYLQQSLIHKADFLNAIELLCALNLNAGKGKLNKLFIENAFAISPSFELCELYARSTKLDAKNLYQELASLVNTRTHIGIFMAFAAYLGLDDEIKILKTSIDQ